MSDTETCTIRNTNGWGPTAASRSVPCGEPAERIIATTCRCGHTGTTRECEGHAQVPDADRFCHECNAAGCMGCPVTIRVIEEIW